MDLNERDWRKPKPRIGLADVALNQCQIVLNMIKAVLNQDGLDDMERLNRIEQIIHVYKTLCSPTQYPDDWK